jgi:hypothetical protein
MRTPSYADPEKDRERVPKEAIQCFAKCFMSRITS